MTEDGSRALDFGPWDPGQPCKTGNAGACSLPPRKRLLAGLKQNGWLPPWQTCVDEADLMGEIKLEVDLRGGDDDSAVAEVSGERDGLHSSACGSGSDSDSDVSDKPCKRQKCLSILSDSPNKPLPEDNPKTNQQNKSVKKKKKKHAKDAQSNVMPSKGIDDVDHDDGGNDDLITYNEIVNAAKASAARCAKAAAETKAIAMAKAAAAAQAAAVAKAALDAIAIVTEDMSKPAEDYLFSCKKKGNNKGKTKDEVHMSSEDDCKFTISIDVSRKDPGGVENSNPCFADDAELARQLHRAMNSSPRIYRNLLLLKKCETSRFSTVKKCEKSSNSSLSCKIAQRSDKCGKLYRKKGKIHTTKKNHKSRNKGRPGRADVKLKSVNAINETLNFLQGQGPSNNTVLSGSVQALENASKMNTNTIEICGKKIPFLENGTVYQTTEDCNDHFVNTELAGDTPSVRQSPAKLLYTCKAKREAQANNNRKTLPLMEEKSESDNVQSITIDLQVAESHTIEPVTDKRLGNSSSMDRSPAAERAPLKAVMLEDVDQLNSSVTVPPPFTWEIESTNDNSVVRLSNHACDKNQSLSA